MQRGFIIAICVMCLFNGCICNCGPQSSGGCFQSNNSSGCTFDAGLMPVDSGSPDSTFPGQDGGPDATEEADATAVGLCNGQVCAAGCSCDIVDDDAGGGVACECAIAGDAGAGDASPDATSAPDAADAETSPDATSGDAGGHADASVDATSDASEPTACGVITCGAGCVCVSPGASQCVCP